jgi:glycosyltransferase involved in cell wall biosynthesis
MNVGLVVPGFSADANDWCIPALRHLARRLSVTDHVRVVAVRYPFRYDRYTVDAADVIALGGAERRGGATAALWRDGLKLLAAEHRRQPFSVLHAFWATESGLLAAVAGRLLRVPVLVSLAGGELVALRDIDYGDQRLAWERLKIRVSLGLASAVSAGSQLLLSIARRHVALPRLHRAPLGVNAAVFCPSSGASVVTEPRLLHVATLTRVKDQVTLLRAFALLRRHDPRARLEIVGEGPLRPELERLATALELTCSVNFRGEVDHARLPTVYRAASVFVLSSRHEAQSMAALEAAACGLPVVGTSVGVLPELTPAVVPIGAHADLARAMQAAITAAPVAAETTHRVRAEFGLDTCTDRFRDLYMTLRAA